jgi:hypothetical protein
LSVWMTLSQPY